RVAGRPTSELVPAMLSASLRALAFPKRMSWDAWLDDGRGAFPFGRPIRWLLAAFDRKPVHFAIHALVAGAKGPVIVEAGLATRGRRFRPKGRGGELVAAGRFGELREVLGERFVLVEPAARAARIEEGMTEAAAGLPFEDHGLHLEWRDLVEFP